MKHRKEDYIAHFHKLFQWISDHEFKSHDICDVTATPFYIWLQQVKQNHGPGKYLYYPFYRIARDSPGIIRSSLRIPPREYAQSNALITNALIDFQEKTGESVFNDTLIPLLNGFSASSSAEDPHMAWGQPYDWFSRKRIPAHTPRTTVTTQVAHALLDAFQHYGEEQYLDWAWKAGKFLVEKMPWDRDSHGNICFPYTSIDRFHIHNANVLAAALLMRLASYRKNEQFMDFANRSFAFTASHQNEDGSWFYWAPPDRIAGKIDHYHTGFVLESYQVGADLWEGSFPFRDALERGFSFYMKHLFTEELVPKITPESVYPIDIQSCAQAMITLGKCLEDDRLRETHLQKVYSWVYDHMYDRSEGYFYYRIYRNRIDRTPYLRWAESWMLRAITFLL